MASRVNCPRCGCFASSDEGGPIFCPGCHHRADVPPDQCDCLMCLPEIPMPEPEAPALVLPADFWDAPVREYVHVSHYSAVSRSGEAGISVSALGFTHPIIDTTTFADRIVICVEDEHNEGDDIVVTVSAEMIGKIWQAMQNMTAGGDVKTEERK